MVFHKNIITIIHHIYGDTKKLRRGGVLEVKAVELLRDNSAVV